MNTMEEKPPLAVEPPPEPPKKWRIKWKSLGGKFLIISIAVHVLFLMGATYYVVQIYSAKKLTFKGGAPVTNASARSMEHKVSLANKQKSMSAPAPVRRIVSTAPSAVSLPDIPAMPDASTVTPSSMSGMGGTGVVGSGFGTGVGGGGGGGGMGIFSPFGIKDAKASALTGKFYDFKHTAARQDSKVDGGKYAAEVTRFVKQGMHEGSLNKYLHGSRPLYATEIFFPIIDSDDAPKAFGSPMPESPGEWIAVYRGSVAPPESGTYHFVAAGDDDMFVQFDGKLILDNCEHIDHILQLDEYKYSGERLGYARSLPVTVQAGKYYEVVIVIGDHVPRSTFAKVLVEKEGADYPKDEGTGSPILPIFKLDKGDPTVTGTMPPSHTENGPFWKGRPVQTSLLDP